MAKGLKSSAEDLQKLVNEMRETVEEAETSEPLLSKQLYDTIRQTHQQRPDEALDMTGQLLERGFLEESKQAEQKAQAGISRLKEGVEGAAESVLGDETEAIRRGRDQVDELAKAIDQELEARDRPSGRSEGRSAERPWQEKRRGCEI